MKPFARRQLLRYLATIGIAIAPIDAARQLAAIPEEVLVELLDDVEDDVWNGEDLKTLVRTISKDERPAVRARALRLAAALDPDYVLDRDAALLRTLARDPDPRVRQAAAGTLGALLVAAQPLARTAVASEWAVHDSSRVRETIALALARPFSLLGGELIVEQLVKDADPTVRSAAAGAARAHRGQDPQHFDGLLAALRRDPVERVRQAALDPTLA